MKTTRHLQPLVSLICPSRLFKCTWHSSVKSFLYLLNICFSSTWFLFDITEIHARVCLCVQEIVLWRKAPEKMRKRNFHQRYESPESQTQPLDAEQPEMWGLRYELQIHTDTPQIFTAEQPEVWGLPHSFPGLRHICIHEYTHIPSDISLTQTQLEMLAVLQPSRPRTEIHSHTDARAYKTSLLNAKCQGKSANPIDPSSEAVRLGD